MDFDEIAWAAVCFYYRSLGDNRYAKIMMDGPFLSKLKTAPSSIYVEELEQKLVLDYVNIDNYDLLFSHDLAGNILDTIVELQPDILFLKDYSLLDCDLSNTELVDRMRRVYSRLCAIYGLWLTGASKIAHILNDRLFVILNLDVSRHFRLLEDAGGLVKWLSIMQENAQEVTRDFNERGFSGMPEQFLSDKLGYTDIGYQKSLVKFLDEYFWLRFGDNLPVPPLWAPSHPVEKTRE